VRVFSCQSCGQRTYFENVRCESCRTLLGFLPERRELHAFRPVPDAGEECWAPVAPEVPVRFRRCANWVDHDVCNWMVADGSPQPYCLACRLNDVIPDLSQPGNLQLWAETWAHYLHIRSTLETAEAVGIRATPSCEAASRPDAAFDELLACWTPLTAALNELNRSMGLPDLYPFVLSAPAVDKLRFVHDLVSRHRSG
jgi:hypothetical protein